MRQNPTQNPGITLLSLGSLKKRLTELLKKHPELSSIFILLCANVFNNLITFVINIFLAKKIGPENFGIYSLAVSIMMTVNFVTELGLGLGMVRFFNLYKNNKDHQRLVLSSLLIFRLSVIMLLVVISYPLGIMLSKRLSFGHTYPTLLSLIIISGAILTLWIYLQKFFQAHRTFSKLSHYIYAYAVARILCFVLLYVLYNNISNISAVLASLYTIPTAVITLMGIVPIVIVFFRYGFPSVSNILNTVGKILQYSKWVAVSSISYNMILRSIQFILAIRTSNIELGIFSAGFVFTVAFSTLNMAVRSVFFPYVTAFNKTSDMRSHLIRIKKLFPFYLIFMLVGITILAVIQIAFLGYEYSSALPVFLITSAALALSIFMGLISMLLHTLMRPEVDAFVNVLRLITAGGLVYFLSPNFGAIGGAIGYAIPIVLGELFMVFYVRGIINEKSPN